ncbi:hypothetical protein VB712_03130 [Spirulina sp. CCNP1310]|uniref:hypothetical protein n=1 Tax=Spirulina sp. CCNP1310 TaxID=3110249 RepID=UPI002B20B96B|nr:hypothetical protein [Spirulina sp. CCNP1310]MEA5418202.1 hypothetical protein [Spirulina sp. CCNP1310]
MVNDTQAVLIKAQDQLTQRDVDQHLERLAKFKQFMPRYRDTQALGAVAAMVVTDEVADYAYRQGLFVLAQSGENVVILNDAQFQPQGGNWGKKPGFDPLARLLPLLRPA